MIRHEGFFTLLWLWAVCMMFAGIVLKADTGFMTLGLFLVTGIPVALWCARDPKGAGDDPR